MKFAKVILFSSCLMLALTGCDKIKSLIDSKGEAKEESTEAVKKDTVVVIEKHYVNESAVQPAAAAPQQRANDSAIIDYTWLSEDNLSYGDIANYSKDELRILRNAIYARHGYRFKSQDLTDYFSQFSWYQPLYDDVSGKLSKIERENIKFIKQYE
ncbi:MAG: YARHG domain-containing protein [Muribaculaceae bacterium]|nr:YARHG domain-containing protein [Muribaculaceae bacterium]